MPDSGPANDTAAPEPPPSRRRRASRITLRWLWRGTKAMALLVLLTLVLGVIWITWTNHRGQAAVEAAVADMISQGQAPATPVPAAENGAPHFRAAAALMVQTDGLREDWPVFGLADWPQFGVRINSDQITILKEIVQLNQQTYEQIDELRPFNFVGLKGDRPLGLREHVEVLGHARRLARCLQIRFVLETALGNTAAAIQTVADIRRVASTLRPSAALIDRLVEISIDSLNRGIIEEAISRGVFPDAELRAMQQTLISALGGPAITEIALRDTQTDVARWIDPDAALNHTIAQGAYLNDVWDEAREAMREALTGSSMPAIELWWVDWIERAQVAYARICPGSMQLRVLDEYDVLQQALAMIERDGRLNRQWVDTKQDQGYLVPASLDSSLRTSEQHKSILLCHIYGLEAERYRLAHGGWPDSIEALTVEAVEPIDAWGNRLALTRTDRGLRVYTLSSNGRDDGGLNRFDDFDWNDYPDGEPNDWHMKLLDPEVRGTLTPDK